MCGITGALSLENPKINVEYIKPISNKMDPDDSGYLCFHTGTKNKDQSYYQNLTDAKYLNKDNKLS